MNNQDLWINKYKPSSLNKIIGNSTQISNFKEWITNLNNNPGYFINICGVIKNSNIITFKKINHLHNICEFNYQKLLY